MGSARRHREYLESTLVEANARLRTRTSIPTIPLASEEETRDWLLAQGLREIRAPLETRPAVTYLLHDSAREAFLRKGIPTSFAVLPAGTEYIDPHAEMPFWCKISGMVEYYLHLQGRSPVVSGRRACDGDRLICMKNTYDALPSPASPTEASR